jgi:hypothetical protein
MITRQVKWVIPNSTDPARQIARLGGEDFDHSISEAIANAHLELCRYYIKVEDREVELVVDVRPGPAYLRAAEGIGDPDLLLSLSKLE